MADYWEVESQSWLGSMEELRSVVHLVEASGSRSGTLLSPEDAGR
jgi:hypothetical protein